MIIPIRLTTQMFDRLAEVAARERRPLPWQAEVMLARALGIISLEAIATQAIPANAEPEATS